MFDAAIALLPEGSHFVMGAKVNHQVLPTASVAQAHSYMIDINRVFMPNEFRLVHWVGEFYPSFDLEDFVHEVWAKTTQKVDKLIREGALTV